MPSNNLLPPQHVQKRCVLTPPLALAVLFFFAAHAYAQVLTPFEVKEPAARRLQGHWLAQLNAIGSEVLAHQFPYAFYFSRQLDVDEPKQQRLEQSSIRFEKYKSQMILEITGNYYAAYSDVLMDRTARLKKTFEDVVLPILKIAEPKFPGDDSFTAFAIEVSHHVRRRAMGGIVTENPENVTFILPRAAAHHLVTAANVDQAQAALLDSEVYVDAEPITLWLTDKHPEEVAVRKPEKTKAAEDAVLDASPMAPRQPSMVSTAVLKGTLPVRVVTPGELNQLRIAYQDTIGRLLPALDAQAHFVSYAPPAFVGFHSGAYLQLSVTSTLGARAGSRYELAALAFDDHISHLIRPVLAFFQQANDFYGFSFSTTLKLPDGNNSEAVEFFFPFEAIRCYANYDCTGQQLIDSGITLINGERVGLNLQAAEAISSK